MTLTDNMFDVKKDTQAAMEILNSMLPHNPKHKYFTRGDSKDRYFYTSELCNHKGAKRYVAGVYRHVQSKRHFKLVKLVGFAKKWRAIKWARDARDKNL